MAAFLEAIEAGIQWLELDVRLSRDGELLVYHDATIGGRAVAKMTAAEALAAARKSGLELQRLREVLRAARGHGAVASGPACLFIECKDAGTEQPLADLLLAEKFQAHAVVISFQTSLVKNLKNLLPEVRTGILCSGRLTHPLGALREAQANFLLPRHPLVSHGLVQEIHAAGYEVVTWTVNRKHEMARLIRAGVDGIITDRPDLLQEVLQSFGSQG